MKQHCSIDSGLDKMSLRECKGCTSFNHCIYLKNFPSYMLKDCPCINCIIKIKCVIGCQNLHKFFQRMIEWKLMKPYEDRE